MEKSSARKMGVIIGLVGSLSFVGLQVASIFRSTSSTAAVGIVFIPVWGLMAFALFFAVGSCLGFIRNQRAQGHSLSVRLGLAVLFVITVGGYVAKEIVTDLVVLKTVSQIENAQNENEVLSVYNGSLVGKNKFVLGAIAQKPVTSTQLLDQIAHLKDSELFEGMGSLFPLLGKNRKGLAVMRLVVSNPNVSVQSVEYLAATTQQEDVLGTIASSPKTSAETLQKLAQNKNYLIDWGLAQNQNTPKEVFTQLLQREKSSTRHTTLQFLLQNHSASADIQEQAQKLLKESN